MTAGGTASNNIIASIQHDGLPGRHPALRVKPAELIFIAADDQRRRLRPTVGRALHQKFTGQRLVRPSKIIDRLVIDEKLLLMTDGHRRSAVVDVDHVPPFGITTEIQTLSLAVGDELDRIHRADLTAITVDDPSRPQWDPITEKYLPASLGVDEAHILAVRFVCGAQTELTGETTDIVFGKIADRERQPSELGLIEHVQHVGLILGRISAPSDTTDSMIVG